MKPKTKTGKINALLAELNLRRSITKARAAQILGEKRLNDSTWKRYKKELRESYSCALAYDAKTKTSTVPRDWTLAPAPRMDPRKRDILVRQRVDLPRLGSPFIDALRPLFDKWEMQFSEIDPKAEQLAPARQPLPRTSAEFYRNLAACETAIRERRVLQFVYRKSADGKVSERHILPYDLYDHNGRIYVWGPEEGGEIEKFFALDRMSDAEVLEGFAKFDPGRSLDDSLRQSFGMFIARGKDAVPREITVKVANHRSADVRARRWPAETAIEDLPDGSLVIKFRVADPREVVAWVLGFGGDAKVLAPPEAAEMARHFAEAIRKDHEWAENAPVDERFLRFDWGDKSE